MDHQTEFVPPANASEGFLSNDLTFKEHEFTIDNLPPLNLIVLS